MSIDWIPLGPYSYRDALFLTPNVDQNLQWGAYFLLVDPGQLETKGDVLYVERVIGSMWFEFGSTTGTAASGVALTERIYVSEVDNGGQLPAGLAQDLYGVSDYDRSFLWERRRYMRSGTTPMEDSTFAHPFWSTLDLRVGRKLKGRQVLIYDVEVKYINNAITPQVEDYFGVWPSLRTLVKF